ncbi:hypothetical protein ACM0P6_04335 [Komagataeibacter sucrofermentans]|uniref:hypothetical protein n=1 Tax=Komagataeibacter sucrofermentans TaxID=1053551 RepID=UPI0011B824E5|nr:hypothetical protein [Komagataeibacter sucrofermentans]
MTPHAFILPAGFYPATPRWGRTYFSVTLLINNNKTFHLSPFVKKAAHNGALKSKEASKNAIFKKTWHPETVIVFYQ